MRIFSHLFARTLPRSLAGSALGLSGTYVLARRALPGADADAGGAVLLWLHLPAALAGLVALATLVEVWPTFARGGPGGELLGRALGTRLSGTASAALGCLTALALALLALGIAFPRVASLLGHELPAPRAAVRFAPEGPQLLDAARPRIVLVPLRGGPVSEVVLRPQGLLPPGGDISWPRVTVTAERLDGEAGPAVEIGHALELKGASDPVRLRVPRGGAIRLVLERAAPGGLPLFFGPEAVLGLGAEVHAPALGSALAALWHLSWATTVAMLLLAIRGLCSLPVLLLVVLGAGGVLGLLGLTPAGEVTAALARGLWLDARDQIRAALPSFSLAVLAMILAWLRRTRPEA